MNPPSPDDANELEQMESFQHLAAFQTEAIRHRPELRKIAERHPGDVDVEYLIVRIAMAEATVSMQHRTIESLQALSDGQLTLPLTEAQQEKSEAGHVQLPPFSPEPKDGP